MKKIIVLAFTLICLLPACNKANIIDSTEKEGKDCLVSFNPVGEIMTSESVITKASMTDDIYLVQVYKGSENFALGYFDNLESMKLYLKQGSSYRIIVAMVKDAKNLLGARYNLQQNSISNYGNIDSFDFTFRNGSGASSTYLSSNFSPAYSYPLNYYQFGYLNKVVYYKSESATNLVSYALYAGTQYFYFTNIEHSCLNSNNYPTCVDWFYGEANNFQPAGDYETIDLNFKRVGFKLKYELSGVTDGEVTVRVYNGTRTFIENTSNTSTYSSDTQFIAFYDAKSAWQYAEDYSENINIAVVWKRGIGVTQDLGTKVIQVKRNCLNNIKIVLGSDDRGAGVNMAIESDSSMNGTTTDIPVQ